jgi:hypothetical protein
MKNQKYIEFFVAIIVTIIFFYIMLKKINDVVKVNSHSNSASVEKQLELTNIKLDSMSQKIDFMIQKQYEIQDSLMGNQRP